MSENKLFLNCILKESKYFDSNYFARFMTSKIYCLSTWVYLVILSLLTLVWLISPRYGCCKHVIKYKKSLVGVILFNVCEKPLFFDEKWPLRFPSTFQNVDKKCKFLFYFLDFGLKNVGFSNLENYKIIYIDTFSQYPHLLNIQGRAQLKGRVALLKIFNKWAGL